MINRRRILGATALVAGVAAGLHQLITGRKQRHQRFSTHTEQRRIRRRRKPDVARAQADIGGQHV